MECSKAREALSSLLDGEPVVSVPLGADLEAHVRDCVACRTFAERARNLDALTRGDEAQFPDVTAEVIGAVRTDRRRRAYLLWASALRLGLVGVGVAQLGLAVPGLFFGTDEGAPIHVAHEVGAWDLALAVAFVYAAWRPLRAIGLLPFAAALSAGLILTAGIDVVHAHAVALTETTHLLELVGTALLYLLTAPPVRARRRPQLRVV